MEFPKAPSETLDAHQQEKQVIVLSVQKDGLCHLNVGSEKAQQVDCKQLAPRRVEVEELLKRVPQPPVLVRADKDVRYEQVIQAMAALKAAGAVKVGLSTAPPDERPVGG